MEWVQKESDKKEQYQFFLNKGKVPWKNCLTALHACLLGNTESRRRHPKRSKGLEPGSSLHKRFRTCHTGGIGLGPQQKQSQYRAVAIDIKEERGHQQKWTEFSLSSYIFTFLCNHLCEYSFK